MTLKQIAVGTMLSGANRIDPTTGFATGLVRDARPVLPINPWKMRVQLNGAQNIAASTWVKILFDTVGFDSSNGFSTSTSQYTVPIAGFWQIQAVLGITSPAGNGTYIFSIAAFNNGSIVSTGAGSIYTNNAATAEILYAQYPQTIFLNTGDLVDIRGNQNFGVAGAMANGTCLWDMHLLSG